MNGLTTKKTMTVKEVSEVLGVSRQLISEWVKKIYPESVKNGVETKLDISQVTEIKNNITINPNIPSTIVEAVTEIDEYKIIAKAQQILQRKIKELKNINQLQENRIKRLIHDQKTYTTTEIAKELNLKSANELNKIISDKGIQYKSNNTWVLCTKYSNCDYETIKQEELDNGKIIYNRHWTGKGREFIINLLSEVKK